MQGYGKGFNLVGDFYAQGICVRQSHREAIKWYLDGASCKDPDAVSYAEYKLAGCLANGLGVEQDVDAAVEWYEKAAEQNDMESLVALAKLYLSGKKDKDGNVRDVALGFDTLQEYADISTDLGAYVGRNANRIADARFELDGVVYELDANNNENNLHSGFST
jgi:TPR repeat protein